MRQVISLESENLRELERNAVKITGFMLEKGYRVVSISKATRGLSKMWKKTLIFQPKTHQDLTEGGQYGK